MSTPDRPPPPEGPRTPSGARAPREAAAAAPAKSADARRKSLAAGLEIALEIARASGLGLTRGRLLVPTPRLVALARSALASTKAVESIEIVPGDGDVRLHLVLRMMGASSRVVVRAAVAALSLGADGGALQLRLLESPTFAAKHGGKAGGMMGVLGAFGEAALASMGPERIVQTVAELIGPPLEAIGDHLTLDLGQIPAVRKLVQRATPLGRFGDLVQVSGASFRPSGLEIALRVRPKSAVTTVRARLGV
jgi:hypothetical protein